jgi:hypothetical protein
MERIVGIIGLALFTFFLCMPVSADASWSQNWYENGYFGTPAKHYNFTKIEGFIVSDPAITEWEGLTPQNPGWSSQIVNPSYSVMSGPATRSLNLATIFSGDKYDGFVLDLVVWRNNNVIGAERITAGSNYSYEEFNVRDSAVLSMLSSYNRSPVPIPSAIWLLGAGLIGFIGVRRKMSFG